MTIRPMTVIITMMGIKMTTIKITIRIQKIKTRDFITICELKIYLN